VLAGKAAILNCGPSIRLPDPAFRSVRNFAPVERALVEPIETSRLPYKF
jgi:hypothetical protein